MKVVTILALSLASLSVGAEPNIVSLDMEPGYWETTVEIKQSQALKDMFSSLPNEQRDLLMSQMESALTPSTNTQCMTKELIRDMPAFLRENLGSHSETCDLTVTESTRTELIAEINCDGVPTVMHTKVINSKKHESVASSSVPGMGETIVNMVSEWKSATCPAGS